MSVKTVFKTLIGVPVILAVLSCIVEIYNINMTSLRVQSVVKMAANQACVLFSQESYKSSDSGRGMSNMNNVVNSSGVEYVSGVFYGTLNANDIYNNIYTSADFRNWLNSEAVRKGNWRSVELIKQAVNGTNLDLPFPGWEASEEAKEAYTNSQIAKMYKETLITPLNMGVPYLDPKITNAMFRWNLAQIASNCNPANIHTDPATGKMYVAFSGFRIYASEARITRFDYVTYDLRNDRDKRDFEALTHIDPDNLGYLYDAAALGVDNDERMRVCVVGIEYDVPISYEGVTPIKQIFNWVWDNEVEGLNGNSGRTVHQDWQDNATSTVSGGGRTGNGSLPVSGKLVYYIVR